MSIWIAGDTHGRLDLAKVILLEEKVKKSDYLIILGDTGIGMNNGNERDYQLLEYYRTYPCKVLFIDGNHDNFTWLENQPVKKWKGGKVHRINSNLYHLMRGEIFNIDNKTFFCMGGGYSIDKQYEIALGTWWKEEMPNYKEYENGLHNLEKVNNKVDYVLSHTCPDIAISYMREKELIDYIIRGEEQLREYLQQIYETVEFKHWYFGHWHFDTKLSNKLTVLYKGVVKI